jgi:hypothetical protein
MSRFAALAALLVLPLLSAGARPEDDAAGPAASQPTVIILVRHAERPADLSKNPDPELTEEGRRRAEALKAALADAKVDAIYVTDLTRNRQTVEPLAKALNLTPILVNPARFARPIPTGKELKAEFLEKHAGKTILFCGNHGAPGILERVYREFGGAGTPPSRYVDLYTIIVPPNGGEPRIIAAQYGGPSSADE